MSELKSFTFKSFNNIDGETNRIEFSSKGYIKDNNILYFKHEENSYKFVSGESLLVYVNNSVYEFNLNKKTLAHIENQGFSMNASIHTSKLEISNDKLYIEYTMDFNTFKGEYSISLEWN